MNVFESQRDIPRAVLGDHPDDYPTAEQWCRDQAVPGDHILAWFAQKNMVDNDPGIEEFCAQKGVFVGATRGRNVPQGWSHGPALVMWPDMDDLAVVEKLRGVTAICAIPYDVDRIRPWIDGHRVALLSESEQLTTSAIELNPVVKRVLKGMNPNLNNTLKGGADKDIVVAPLLDLHDRGYALDVKAIKTWAVSAGWPGERVEELGAWAGQIAEGKRPRVRLRLRDGWLERIEDELRVLG